MYNITEREILTEWSLETLVNKVRSGFNFELMKKGIPIKKEKKLLTQSELDNIEDLYR
ncbi:conserved hypothetical protein [Treponema phagedenis]|uniref:Uncharacterized protein n=1 Tax=Treponema phagedenis TaxID=162 RepID=A0A0B7GXB5_TREPH|nr:hypothetical protein [Treponema phagedenis]CEM62227.1 conserved hypothetical protein [Treponema phagedenis]